MSTNLSTGDVVVLHPAAARADPGAVVPLRADKVDLRTETADLTNVIPFLRPRASDAAHGAQDVVLPPDLVRTAGTPARDRAPLVAFAVLSLALHGAIAGALFWHEPAPLASVGLEVISVELDLGATAPAGVAPTPGENEMPSAPAPDQPVAETRPAEEVATAQPQTAEVAKQEAAPEQKAEEIKPGDVKEAAPQSEPAAVVVAPAQPEPQSAVAMTEPVAPRETKPVETPAQAAPKPVKDAAPAKEPRRIAAPTREKAARHANAATASAPANNIGVGRPSDDTNYRGLVAAHLSRYKHPLPDTRGTATVTFTVGTSGAVTSVRLAHGSGVAGIDSEVQAMVRRASPFPPPPGGRPQSFTVPVSFKVN